MDNDNLSKIPVSELTPENLNSLKGDQSAPIEKSRPRPKRPQGTSRLPLLIAGVVLIIGVGVALFFIFRKPAEPETPPAPEAGNELEVVWEPSENSEDPNQEYLDHHQSIIDSPDTTADEKFDSLLSIANLYTVEQRYEESEQILNGISREGLTINNQFRLYSVYQYLYEQSGDTAAAEEYAKLADEALNAYWAEQPEPTSSEE